MKKHQFYFTDALGRFNGFDRQSVWVDPSQQRLHVGNRLSVPLAEVVRVEIRPLPKSAKTPYLAIDLQGPSIEQGRPTTLALIHKNFIGSTKREVMQAFVDEISPLVQRRSETQASASNPSARENPSAASPNQAQYALNISLLIGFYRKLWYSFDTSRALVTKTLLLMLLGGIVNVFGVLLIAVPFDNYNMSNNLVRAGWSRGARWMAYGLTTCPAYVFWAIQIAKWSSAKS